MSLEESMKDLADANRELAAGLREYSAVIKKVGLKALGEDDGTGDAKPAAEKSTTTDKKKAGRPAGKGKDKPAPVEEEEEQENDGLGDGDEEEEEEEAEGPDREAVKKLLQKLGTAYDDRAVASAIFRDMGFKAFTDVPDNKLQAVFDAATKKLKKAPKD